MSWKSLSWCSLASSSAWKRLMDAGSRATPRCESSRSMRLRPLIVALRESISIERRESSCDTLFHCMRTLAIALVEVGLA